MKDLIEKLAAARAPERSLDREIAKVLGWHRVEPRHTSNKHGAWIAPQDWIGANSDGSPVLDSLHGTDLHRDVPEFTKSTDAAFTFVPDGAGVSLERYWLSDREAWTAVLSTGGVPSDPARRFVCEDAHNAAIALSTAALKARK